MKKLLVVIAVLAITVMSSMAFAAAEITLGGSVDIRSRAFNGLDLNEDVQTAAPAVDKQRDTQTRVRIDVDAKMGDAKAKIEIQRDWEQWGNDNTGFLGSDIAIDNQGFSAIRESWLDIPLFGPVRLKGGHQFLALGNSWFLRNVRNGDDAWMAYAGLDNLTVALVDAKVANRNFNADSDFYAGLAVFKLGDMGAAGVNVSHIVLAKKDFPVAGAGGNILQNVGAHANLGLGPVKLQAEVDLQMGKDKTIPAAVAKYKGNQIVIQGTIPMDPVTVNFTAARGSGMKPTDTNIKEYIPVQDVDPHYTLLYEYKIPTAAAISPYGVGTADEGLHTGFANTTALSAGADVKLGSLTVGGNVWWLQATEDVINGAGVAESDLGIEIDARVNWKISDNVSWNWTLGYFMPGDAYKISAIKDADKATGIQGVLSTKF